MFVGLSIVALVAVGIVAWYFWSEGAPFFGSLFFIGLSTVIIFFFLVLIPGTVVANWVADDTTVSRPIYELGDGTSMSGAFGMFGGYINSEPAFMYYIKNENGAYELRQVEADRVQIVQDNSVRPHYDRTCQEWSTVPEWLKVPFMSYSGIDCDDDSEYIFYVPENSIKGSYNLDAE